MDIIKKFKEIFPEYDYSEVEYKNIKTNVKIICNKIGDDGEMHGVFSKIPEVLLRGHGCPKCSGIDNVKEYGYWNNLEHCIEEAKKYKNKFSFQKGSWGAYNAVRRNGWVNIIDELYDKTIIYKNYHDKIHTIYVYKFEELHTCYVGRTNNLKRRHRQHSTVVKHKNGKISFDNVYGFCQENNVQLPNPIILEENLNARESQIQEDFWVKKYKSEGWGVLNKAKTGENVGSLGASFKWDYENCKKESGKYSSKNEFKINNQSAYNSSVRNKWIDEFFTDKCKPNGYWNNLDHCIEEAKNFKNVKEFSIKGGGAYNIARKNGWVKYLKFKNE